MQNKETLTQKENSAALITIIILCLLIILPLLVIGIYNRPSADDYGYAAETHKVVQNGGNIIAVIKTAWETNLAYYNSWQGLYSAAFIQALQPAIYGEQYYALTGFIIMAIAFVCVFFSVKIINKHYLHYSRLFNWAASLFVTAFLFLWLPSPVQSLYWYSGAMNYVPWCFLDLLSICLIIEIYYSDEKIKNVLLLLLISAIAFVVSGGNPVTSFENILFLLFSVIIVWIKKRRCFPLLPLLSACIGFYIMCRAPGTAIRQSVLAKQTVPGTIFHSAIEFWGLSESWISVTFVLSLILMVPAAIRFSKENPTHGTGKLPWLPVVMSVTVICGMLCVPYYPMGSFGDGRVTGVIWITFTWLGWLLFFLFFRWAYEWIVSNSIKIEWKHNKIFECLAAAVLIILIVLVPRNRAYSSSVYAVKELVTGKAKAYGTQLDERFYILNNDPSPDLVVEDIKHKSRLLFFEDITTDPGDWKNVGMSEYYGKSSIVIAADESLE